LIGRIPGQILTAEISRIRTYLARPRVLGRTRHLPKCVTATITAIRPVKISGFNSFPYLFLKNRLLRISMPINRTHDASMTDENAASTGHQARSMLSPVVLLK
jgi:hypothetical protein